MSVLIKGMKMPKAGSWKTIRIYYDGTCAEPNWQGDCTFMKSCEAVPIPDHGDLIARDALYERTAEWEAQALHMCEVTMQDEDTTEWKRWSTILTERSAFKYDVADAPTVIPAERSEE